MELPKNSISWLKTLPPITAKLYYDFEDGEPREVETLKIPPLEYTCHVNESGDKAAVQIRIGVLSSQHEGAYFRVKLSARNPGTGEHFEAFSHPLKIISKRNQVKKILAKQQQQQHQLQTSPVSSPQSSPILSPIRTSAITSDDMVAQVLLRLEEQQRDQSQMLQQLCQHIKPKKRSLDDDLESALENFLVAFKNAPVAERSGKIRKVLKNSSASEQSMMEFVELCKLEGHPSQVDGEHPVCNGINCPYKRELDKLDVLYSDFLTDPISSPENLF